MRYATVMVGLALGQPNEARLEVCAQLAELQVQRDLAARTEQRQRALLEFEKKALSRLGGSICFVSKKGFIWKGDGADGTGTKDR